MTTTQPAPATAETGEPEAIEYPIPEGGWVCFHCNETFTERNTAAEHFGNGDYEAEIPACIEAATTEQKQLIATNREMWDQLLKAQNEAEDFEYKLGCWEYTARKLTKKASATSHDLEHEWDFMEGKVIAAESQHAALLREREALRSCLQRVTRNLDEVIGTTARAVDQLQRNAGAMVKESVDSIAEARAALGDKQ